MVENLRSVLSATLRPQVVDPSKTLVTIREGAIDAQCAKSNDTLPVKRVWHVRVARWPGHAGQTSLPVGIFPPRDLLLFWLSAGLRQRKVEVAGSS